MNEEQKPFACAIEGCQMTFTNEDHLNWHRKKHDMVLNLGLANKNNEVADQTPTPTRFIRNCEEVGLFQDLQNVNPFDEFFKKAVEITKSGGTLEVHEINSDDTLHTPHILPHIEECQKKTTLSDNINQDDNSHFNEFTLNNVIAITSDCDQNVRTEIEQISEPIIEIHEDSQLGENSRKSVKSKNNTSVKTKQNDEVIPMNDVKMKIKQTLQIRGKQKKGITNNNNDNTSNTSKNIVKHASQANPPSSPLGKEKIRAMNRAAQVRCRKRKAEKWKEMEEEISILKSENKRVKLENKRLKLLNTLLKQELTIMGNTFASEKYNVDNEGNLLVTLVTIIKCTIYM